ncbi:hypothetical protein [Halostagnicola sp. A-GB9-2]|uniref:hypothetical protein n=1 Tax=Halostagnicola sp. A-GB9-2 TaxID=3048066 RepID=UPI0024C09A40|nr:hypothetical protein [Halostagnicola sp. A-GB9-2]MDJ1432448.1 hypothetical protein [Halostagnicola sp. A-GB9-2]
MISRRNRAILELLASLFALTISIRPLLERRENGDRIGPTPGTSDAAMQPRDSNVPTRDPDHQRPGNAFVAGVAEGTPDDPLSPRWFLCGFATAVGYRHRYDHDVGSIRQSRARRIGFGALEVLSGLLLARYDENASHSFGVGSCAGAVVYRVKYGLLNEPPGE